MTWSRSSICWRRTCRHRRKVSQLHWGGGTPTYYSRRAARAHLRALRAGTSSLDADAEVGIEIDPRVTTSDTADGAAPAGLQPPVDGRAGLRPRTCRWPSTASRATSRRARCIEHARADGFALDQRRPDLRPAVPDARRPSAARSTRCSTLRPDRVAAYSFAFVPWMRAHMKHIARRRAADAGA